MSYEGFYRKGTRLEREARALQLTQQVEDRLADAQRLSVEADKLNTYSAHVAAARAWRRIIYPATRLNQDATIYREAVQRHVEASEVAQKHKSAQS